jgi:putative proteasome-type protease
MTNGVGIMLDTGLIFESDSRAHARVDNFARFCKKTVFERARDQRVIAIKFGQSGWDIGRH